MLRWTLIALCSLCLCSCFTGIENTPKVTDRQVKRVIPATTTEQTLLANVMPQPTHDWHPGKQFIATDGNFAVAYQPSSIAETVMPGDTLRLIEVKRLNTLSGRPMSEVTLLTPGRQTLTLRQQLPDTANVILPFLNDLSSITLADSLLHDRTLWTLTRMRYNPDGTYSVGAKYEAVKVTKVNNGTSEFPFAVHFTSTSQGEQMLYMTYNDRTGSLRRFDLLFSLTDPRKKYPTITDDSWRLIQQGKAAAGMTQQECRLSLGQPTDIERTATYSGFNERWIYDNGTLLQFTDGILVSCKP